MIAQPERTVRRGDKTFAVPEDSVDCHMHAFLPAYATIPGRSLAARMPSPNEYLVVQRALGLSRTVVIAPSAYGADNRALLAGMHMLGGARGVASVSPDVPDAYLDSLHEAGVRGIRFNFARGARATMSDLSALDQRVVARGWHMQVNVAAGMLIDLEEPLAALASPIVLDHFARIPRDGGLDGHAFAALSRLLDGSAFIKISGAYLVASPPTFDDAGTVATELMTRWPDRVLWGSDWPHTTATAATFTTDHDLLTKLFAWAPSATHFRSVLVDNPHNLYWNNA